MCVKDFDTFKNRLINDYTFEIQYLQELIKSGTTEVSECTIKHLGNFDTKIPIKEALDFWTSRLSELEAETNDISRFNY